MKTIKKYWYLLVAIIIVMYFLLKKKTNNNESGLMPSDDDFLENKPETNILEGDPKKYVDVEKFQVDFNNFIDAFVIKYNENSIDEKRNERNEFYDILIDYKDLGLKNIMSNNIEFPMLKQDSIFGKQTCLAQNLIFANTKQEKYFYGYKKLRQKLDELEEKLGLFEPIGVNFGGY
jgi:hypothetical protein